MTGGGGGRYFMLGYGVEAMRGHVVMHRNFTAGVSTH